MRKEVFIDCPLTAQPKNGILVVTVRNLDTGAPLAGVRVALDDGARDAPESDGAGAARFEGLSAGYVRGGASDEHHLTFPAAVDVHPRETARVDGTLRPLPTGKSAAVALGAGGIHLLRTLELEADGTVLAPGPISLGETYP